MGQVSESPSGSGLNNIPLCGWTTFCLSIRPSTHPWTLGCFHALSRIMLLGTWVDQPLSRPCVQFLWGVAGS